MRIWREQKLYLVEEKEEAVPVYTVRPIDGTVLKKVHRNMLMKADSLPSDAFEQKRVERVEKKVKRKSGNKDRTRNDGNTAMWEQIRAEPPMETKGRQRNEERRNAGDGTEQNSDPTLVEERRTYRGHTERRK